MIDPILITCPVNPDLDSYASVWGYAEFLHKQGRLPVPGFFGNYSAEVRQIAEKMESSLPEEVEHPEKFDHVALVDCSDLGAFDRRINPFNIITVIDHREIHHARNFPKARFHLELVNATATIVGEYFLEHNISPSKATAMLLQAAIARGLGSPMTDYASAKDEKICQWLSNFCRLPNSVKDCIEILKT